MMATPSETKHKERLEYAFTGYWISPDKIIMDFRDNPTSWFVSDKGQICSSHNIARQTDYSIRGNRITKRGKESGFYVKRTANRINIYGPSNELPWRNR